jgi:hypothetical protein
MESIIVHPENKAQLTALKAVLKAMKIAFEKKEDTYNPEFVEKIRESDEDFKAGRYKTIKTEDLWK